MPIENRGLLAGTRLVANYKKVQYVCMVGVGEGGKVAFVLEDGQRFTSPSAAGSAVMGGVACNGWRFWSVEGDTPAPKAEKASKAAKPKAEKTAPKPKARKPASKTKLLEKAENQDGAGDGRVRYWCNACKAGVLVEGDERPETCPEGHRIDAPELTAPAGEAAEA